MVSAVVFWEPEPHAVASAAVVMMRGRIILAMVQFP
jgi:hypothetical protein